MPQKGKAMAYIVHWFVGSIETDVFYFPSGVEAKAFLRRKGCRFPNQTFGKVEGDKELVLVAGRNYYVVEEDYLPNAAIQNRKR